MEPLHYLQRFRLRINCAKVSAPSQTREGLENFWRERQDVARQQYQLAKAACAEARTSYTNGDTPAPDGQLAFHQALRIETAALAEYKRALGIFVDLTVYRKMPE